MKYWLVILSLSLSLFANNLSLQSANKNNVKSENEVFLFLKENNLLDSKKNENETFLLDSKFRKEFMASCVGYSSGYCDGIGMGPDDCIGTWHDGTNGTCSSTGNNGASCSSSSQCQDIDTTAPTLSSLSSSNITMTSASISATSNESGTMYYVIATSSSSPTYAQVSGNTVTNSVKNGSSSVSASTAKTFSITGLTAGTQYYYYFVAKDASNNQSSVFSGTFTTLTDTTPPTITSVTVPSNGTYKTGDNLDFTIGASENVIVDTTNGTPRIAITIGSTTKYATYSSGSGTSSLVFRYTVESGLSDTDGISVGTLSLNGGTINDSAGNNMTTTLNSVGSTTSVLVDSIAPTISSLSPADDSTNSSKSANLVMTFNENIAIATGNIVIYNSSDNVIATIAVTDSTQVSASGTTLTINPTSNLNINTSYYVQVTSTALTDTAGNPFAGISDKTTWNFTTSSVSSTPQFSNTIATQNVNEGFADFTITVNATDGDNGTITYGATSSNTNVVNVSMSSNVLTISKANNDAYGDSTITLSITANGNTATQTFIVSVANINDAPIIGTTFSNKTYNEDFATKTFDINVSDIEGSSLELNVTSSDTQKVIVTSDFTNPLNQADYSTSKSFRVTPVANANGDVTINISADDGTAVTSTSFDITITPINDAPVVADIADVYVFSGSAQKDINITATDVENNPLTYNVTYSNSSIFDVNTLSGNTISLTPKSGTTSGSSTVNYSVSDANETTSKSFTYNIVNGSGVDTNSTSHSVTIGTVQTKAISTFGGNTTVTATSTGVETSASANGVNAVVDTPTSGSTAGKTTHKLTIGGVTTQMNSEVVGTTTTISDNGSGSPQITSVYTPSSGITFTVKANSNGSATHQVTSGTTTTTASSTITGATTTISSNNTLETRVGVNSGSTIQALVITTSGGLTTTYFVTVSGGTITATIGTGLASGFSYPAGSTTTVSETTGGGISINTKTGSIPNNTQLKF